MAAPKTLWGKTPNGDAVTIYNQPGQTYAIELWEQLKADNGYTDQELAEVLNNFKP